MLVSILGSICSVLMFMLYNSFYFPLDYEYHTDKLILISISLSLSYTKFL